MWSWWEQFWGEFVPEATKGEPFGICVNGDVLDGTHHGATTQWSFNLTDQAAMARTILAPLVAACEGRFYMVRGTEAHVGKSAQEEERLPRDNGAIANAQGQHTREKQKQEESGGVTVDNSSAETHTTIYTISESPQDAKVLWVGTDDGNLQLTRDGGTTWTNLVGNLPGLPKASWMSWVEASRFDAATAYAAFDRHMFDDPAPHVFGTTDYGKTWTRLTAGLPPQGFVWVVRQDPKNPRLLWAATELGLHASYDAGKLWRALRLKNLPTLAVHNVLVHAARK